MFRGAGTALATPFNNDHSIDYEALKRLTKHQVDNKIDAIIVLGTTGESPVIKDDERKKIIETVINEAAGKTEIIVGTGSNDTHHVVELNKIAEQYKEVSGLLIVNPYYNKGTQLSLVEHYKYISERTSLPIMLYNVPSRTGMNILPETVVKIHEQCRNVVAIKEACANISQIAQLISIKPEGLDVYSGNDDQTLPIIALGGAGLISVFSNAFPKEMKLLVDALLKYNYPEAQKLNNKYMELMNALFVEASPMPLKYIMSKLGLCGNVLRLPLTPVTEKSEKFLDEVLKRFKAAY
ncbi:MAG: 4-hydroxy-tetrahydrodipicolinate synthase [Ignavibacteriaceae bacterium]